MVASPGFWNEEGHKTERKYFKGDTRKYHKIYAINSNKATDKYIYPFWISSHTYSPMSEFVRL